LRHVVVVVVVDMMMMIIIIIITIIYCQSRSIKSYMVFETPGNVLCLKKYIKLIIIGRNANIYKAHNVSRPES